MKPIDEKLINVLDNESMVKFKNALENVQNTVSYKCVQKKSNKDIQYIIVGMSWFTKISKTKFIFSSSYFYLPTEVISFSDRTDSLNNIVDYAETKLLTHPIDIVIDISVKSISNDEILLYQNYKSGVDIFENKKVIQYNSYFTYIEGNQ